MFCNSITRTLSMPAVIALALAWPGCAKDSGARIVVSGSTTMFPITQKAMEEFSRSRKVAITIEGNGSASGIRALLGGTADICSSSREMNPREIAQAKSAGIVTEEITCARDMIVPIVHPSSRVTNITLVQLRGIFEGSITNWKLLGGPDEKIMVVARDENSGTRDVWHAALPAKAGAGDGTLVHASHGAVVAAVAGNPRAIGYISFGHMNDSVRALSVEGVKPSIETGKTRAYPITRELYLHVNRVKVSGETREFINSILGAGGRKIITKAGFIPQQP